MPSPERQISRWQRNVIGPLFSSLLAANCRILSLPNPKNAISQKAAKRNKIFAADSRFLPLFHRA